MTLRQPLCIDHRCDNPSCVRPDHLAVGTQKEIAPSGPFVAESDKPLCIDLFCGLGGWTEGFLAEGWRCIGFDIEQHVYGAHRYPAQLVLQDVRTIHGSQFKDAQMIVASSPCQEFSYRAMPWKRAKALGPPVFGMELFAQAERIRKEASAAAGRRIPLIQENVRGAQPWVGRARWMYGFFALWGDVPLLMPMTERRAKVGSLGWSEFAKTGVKSKGFNTTADQLVHGRKGNGGTWFGDYTPSPDGIKQGGDWFDDPVSMSRRSSSKSKARKAASAQIAKIPFPLASYIAQVYYPRATVEPSNG